MEALPDYSESSPPVRPDEAAPFAMFADLQRRYFWIQPTLAYRTKTELVGHVDDALIARANEAARRLEERRAATREAVALGAYPRTD